MEKPSFVVGAADGGGSSDGGELSRLDFVSVPILSSVNAGACQARRACAALRSSIFDSLVDIIGSDMTDVTWRMSLSENRYPLFRDMRYRDGPLPVLYGIGSGLTRSRSGRCSTA